ncbi:MAG: hypothetical protein EZS28_017608 [Streblomastix strix]|uniref:Uncharacterized protein n=1 Tax=Streblomastix strix TaxID=222440 RepID=A0A5J4VVX4_9EUKA|nr:MAG: hypothetical protein EZS28_017608 [Streblomastix strix]
MLTYASNVEFHFFQIVIDKEYREMMSDRISYIQLMHQKQIERQNKREWGIDSDTEAFDLDRYLDFSVDKIVVSQFVKIADGFYKDQEKMRIEAKLRFLGKYQLDENENRISNQYGEVKQEYEYQQDERNQHKINWCENVPDFLLDAEDEQRTV